MMTTTTTPTIIMMIFFFTFEEIEGVKKDKESSGFLLNTKHNIKGSELDRKSISKTHMKRKIKLFKGFWSHDDCTKMLTSCMAQTYVLIRH